MDLYEYQAKHLFGKHNVPVTAGEVCTTADAAREAARKIGSQVVIKAQVKTGGRGKAGGVKLADKPDEAQEIAKAILGMDIKGHTVYKVLVNEASDIAAVRSGHISVTPLHLDLTHESMRRKLVAEFEAAPVDLD